LKTLFKMSVLGTAAMTAFSYLISIRKNEKFLEPLVLNQLVFPAQKGDNAHHMAGYVIHYLVGLFFSKFYQLFWNKGRSSPRIKNAATLGFLNGIFGVIGWHLTYKIHPAPPKISLKKYYLQLLVAHIIFGTANGMVYKQLREKSAIN